MPKWAWQVRSLRGLERAARGLKGLLLPLADCPQSACDQQGRRKPPFLGLGILGVALAIAFLWLAQWGKAQTAPTHAPGEILVKWAPGTPASTAAAARQQVAGVTLRLFSQIGWERLQIDPMMDVQTAIQVILRQPGVIAAEPSYIMHLQSVPNDPGLGLQWGLQNTGQVVNGTAGTPGADISMTSAWDLRTDSPSVIVAVIDSGIELTHTDLKNNLWINPGEVPGNGIDDDGNGLVDDVYGWDFVNNDNNPTDDRFHGTRVAGIIGAKGNDKFGISGVTWTVQLMALKIADPSGAFTIADAVSAILYAGDKGAHIINASWGDYIYSQALKDAIDAFPGLFVTAAGNGGADNIGDDSDLVPVYPACYTSPNIIAVAATDQNDVLADFSNFGMTCVHLAAPGVNILSDALGNTLALGSGTSTATAHVSGVAALLKAQHPNWTTAEIRGAILGTVDTRASLSGKVATGGRLNARAALGGTATSNPETAGGGGAGCFIATAAFGSPLAPQVQLLRKVRDQYLLPHAAGRMIVSTYSRLSPPLADCIARSKTFRAIVRLGLTPLLGWAALTLWSPAVGLGAPLVGLSLVTWVVGRRLHRGRQPRQ